MGPLSVFFSEGVDFVIRFSVDAQKGNFGVVVHALSFSHHVHYAQHMFARMIRSNHCLWALACWPFLAVTHPSPEIVFFTSSIDSAGRVLTSIRSYHLGHSNLIWFVVLEQTPGLLSGGSNHRTSRDQQLSRPLRGLRRSWHGGIAVVLEVLGGNGVLVANSPSGAPSDNIRRWASIDGQWGLWSSSLGAGHCH